MSLKIHTKINNDDRPFILAIVILTSFFSGTFFGYVQVPIKQQWQERFAWQEDLRLELDNLLSEHASGEVAHD